MSHIEQCDQCPEPMEGPHHPGCYRATNTASQEFVRMPHELTDKQADVALAATAKFLDIKGSQLTVNREKMKARYRALVKFIEASGG